MTKPAIRFEMTGIDAAIDVLSAINVDAARSIQTAMRATRTKAAQLTRQKLAARWGIPQKVVKSRVNAYFHPKHQGKVLRLWLGLKHRPRGSEARKVEIAIDRTGDGRRRFLPIEQGADVMMRDAARAAMTERFNPVLRREFKRRLIKRSSKTRRRRR